MKTNDRELKRAYRECVQSPSETPRNGCPPPDDIWQLFAGGKRRKAKERMVDHITTCPECFKKFEAFLEISRAEGNLARDVQSRFRSQPKNPPLPLVWRYAAALLVLMLIISAAVLSTRWLGLSKPPEERGRLSGQLRLLAPSRESTSRTPLIFKWEAVPGSEYYIIEIFDDSLLPFWKSDRFTATDCKLPEQVKERMAKGKDYFWMLTAFSPGGIITESSLEAFRLID